MPRCSEEALETALRQLSEHATSGRKRANWMSTYLAAQRMTHAGYPLTIAGANLGVSDLFSVLPDDERGRSNPFVDLASDYRWQQVQDSGRKTVWNTGTRSGAQTALFNVGPDGNQHFSAGLLPNAVDVMLSNLGSDEPLPARDALSVFLTRDRDWDREPLREELHVAACALLGLDNADFERITADVELGVPVLGDPEWAPALLASSELGPPQVAVGAPGTTTEDELPVADVHELPDRFRRFLAQFGITTGGDEELLDLLAAAMSSQFVIMAGPSGSGKSLMASALAAFFAPPGRRTRLESSRLLAKPQEFFGYYSQLAGDRFMAYGELQALMVVAASDSDASPMITIEEANLSPIEGYLSPLVHGLGALEAEILTIPLHAMSVDVQSQVDDWPIPPFLELGPYPRFLATINVDADSPAPARKVVSRACVLLLETPSFETALAAADSLAHPSVEQSNGPAAGLIRRPTIAFERYAASGSELYQQALTERAEMLREALGVDVIAHRQLQRSLMYMAWFVELSGGEDAEAGDPAIEAAADNTLVHFVLPSLPASQFASAVQALDDGRRAGVLAHRLAKLRIALNEHQFGPPPDFWGALS